MEEEVYILNDEQAQWFINRYQNYNLPQIVITKVDPDIRVIEKKYLTEELYDDVIQYIAEQGIPISMLVVEKPRNDVKE